MEAVINILVCTIPKHFCKFQIQSVADKIRVQKFAVSPSETSAYSRREKNVETDENNSSVRSSSSNYKRHLQKVHLKKRKVLFCTRNRTSARQSICKTT